MACALFQRGDWLGVRCCPTGPPSNVFRNRGTPPVPPAGLRPCTLLGERRRLLTGRVGALPDLPSYLGGGRISLWLALSFSGGIGLACAVVPPAHPPTFLETGGHAVPPAGAAPPAPRWGTGISLWLALSFSGGIGLACAVVPPAHPPTFLETGGLPLYPRRGCAPCTLLGGRGFCCGLRPSSAEGLAWRAPLSHRPTHQRFWKQGDSPCTPGGGCAPCTPLGGSRELALAGRMLPNLRPRRPAGGDDRPSPPPHTQTPISVRWLSSVSAQTRASRRSGLAPLSGVQVQSWSSKSSRPGPTWKTLPCS